MTVEGMLRTMSMHELIEWKAFLRIERSGALTQRTIDLDAKIKAQFAPLMGLAGKAAND